MAVIVPNLVFKLKVTGVSTAPDGQLTLKGGSDFTGGTATDGSTSGGQTSGLIQVKFTTQFEGVKVTWDTGLADIAAGDTVSVFIHSMGTFPPSSGDTFNCMPYITANTVDSTNANWVEIPSPTNDAFNVFTFDAALIAALVDLDSPNGKFSVRLMIDDPTPNSVRRFSRWNEIESNLTQPGGGNTVQGDPDDMLGVAVLDAFPHVIRASAPAVDMAGSATVASQGGVKRDSGAAVSMAGTATIPLVEASFVRGGTSSMTGTATVAAAGDTVGVNEVQSTPANVLSTATVASAGGAKRDSGAVAMTGSATVASAGGAKRDSAAISMVGSATVAADGAPAGVAEIDGAEIFPLEVQNQSILVFSDGTDWWIF